MTRLLTVVALLASGLLAGAFLYGWATVVPAFDAVPLDVHLAFRVALMAQNAPVMQALMGLATAGCLGLAVVRSGPARLAAGAATTLALASLLITKFGNVPINLEIKEWLRTGVPADHLERLHRWAVFNDLRVTAALGAFVLVAAVAAGRPQSSETNQRSPGSQPSVSAK